MTTSTPLPEQGGFNDRLDNIIEQAIRKGIDIGQSQVLNKTQVTMFTTHEEYDAIRTLVLEEIIGDDLPLKFKNSKGFCNLCADSDCCPHHYEDELRAEQRKKLGCTNGAK